MVEHIKELVQNIRTLAEYENGHGVVDMKATAGENPEASGETPCRAE